MKKPMNIKGIAIARTPVPAKALAFALGLTALALLAAPGVLAQQAPTPPIENSLGGFSRIIGWDLSETVHVRARALDEDALKQRPASAPIPGGYKPHDINLWTDLRYNSLTYEATSALDFDGDLVSYRLGMEKPVGNLLTGLVVGVVDGELDFDYTARPGTADVSGTGTVEMYQWNLNPYVAWQMDDVRVWGTVGVGKGDLDYEYGTSVDSSDLTMRMAAIGAEYNIVTRDNLKVVGRAETMSARLSVDAAEGGVVYGSGSAEASGFRGELEVNLDMVGEDTSHFRPYLTVGYRWDGGDDPSSSSLEYGAGMEAATKYFRIDSSVRTQATDDKYERTSYGITFSYDSGRDRQGLNLDVSQRYGSPASFDPSAQNVSWTQSLAGRSSEPVRARTDVEAGYGFAVRGLLTGHRAGLLKPFVRADLDGGADQWTLGLTMDSHYGNIDLTHTVNSTIDSGVIDGSDREQNKLLLSFTFDL